jgi:hypothetical protein
MPFERLLPREDAAPLPRRGGHRGRAAALESVWPAESEPVAGTAVLSGPTAVSPAADLRTAARATVLPTAAAVLPAAAAAEEEASLGAEQFPRAGRVHRLDRHHLGCHERGGNGTPATGSGAAPANAAPAVPQAATIGTPVRDGKFQFTITSVSHAKSVGDTADGFGDTAQGKYTILHVTVTNIGSQPQTLDDSSQYVYDASGRKYDTSTSANMDLNSASGSDSVFFNDINPGNTVRGELAFDMPAGLKAVKAELHDSAFSGGVTVNLR